MVRLMSSVAAIATVAIMGTAALAQQAAPFKAADFEYGPRDVVEGKIQVWNPAKQKILDGADLVGGTIDATDPRTYCAMANAGYDFTWVEMQHQATSWESVARMYATCPQAKAAHGVRIAETSEREIQHALNLGAMVLVVPTIDTAEEAKQVVDWAKFPPVGRHSQGGGQRWAMYADVPDTYRKTLNDNLVIILMVETLEGVENVREIAKTKGIDALMVASGDLGNFSGYKPGEPQYEALVNEITLAAKENGLRLCGPLSWRAEREGFSCFQAGNEAAIIKRGVEAELTATARAGTAAGN